MSWVSKSRTSVKVAWDRLNTTVDFVYPTSIHSPSWQTLTLFRCPLSVQSCVLGEIIQASSHSECSKLTKGLPLSLTSVALVIWSNKKGGIVYWGTPGKDFLTFRKNMTERHLHLLSLETVPSGYTAWCCCSYFVTRSEASLRTKLTNRKMEAQKGIKRLIW